MFLSVVILGRFTTETHAMALYVSIDTPPLLTPHPGTQPRADLVRAWRLRPQPRQNQHPGRMRSTPRPTEHPKFRSPPITIIPTNRF
jgi:hypothetical protein